MKSGCAIVAVSLTLAMSNAALAQTTLRAGAAKVDVTPSAGELPKNSLGILDRLYARAIVLDNGTTSAALITLDAGAIPDPLWQAVSSQIQATAARLASVWLLPGDWPWPGRPPHW